MIHAKIDALRGVMAGGEYGDLCVPDVENTPPRDNAQHICRAGTLAAQGFRRSTAGVQRQTVRCFVSVATPQMWSVCSWVSNADILPGQGKRLQGAAYLPLRGDTGVHQKVGPAGADQQAVTLRPTG